MYVSVLQQFSPLLAAMVVLAAASAFFSCSEAALFSLQADDRRSLKGGNSAQQTAVWLLSQPNRLLTAILFWNLIINIVYFAMASVISLKLEEEQRRTEAGLVAVFSLFALILASEMLPKTVGVLVPRTAAGLVGVPLAVAVKIFDPIAPLFSWTIRILRRVFLPTFRAEPYLELADLEQAITVSTADEELAAQERSALHNIVQLSDLKAEELMRPRTQYQSYHPPVNLVDLGGQLTRSGYLLVTEENSDEIISAIALKNLPTIPRHNLEHFAQPVVYVPWCSPVAAVFDQLQAHQREVAAIVNELGETIGIVTLEDLLHTIFEDQASRSARLLETVPIAQLDANLWRVTGMTSLRRLGRTFQMKLPLSKSSTVAGIVQEKLGRLPVTGDSVRWHLFQFDVIEADELGQLMVELQIVDERRAGQ